MEKTALDTLLEAAILAPSGDNTQPWHFKVDRQQNSILLDVDPTRDTSPMNAGQRMARISLGAALENMVRTAHYNQWTFQIDDAPPNGLIRFTLQPNALVGSIDPLLRDRVSNRRAYTGPTPPKKILETLESSERLSQASSSQPSTETILITDTELLSTLAGLIARADALILGTRSIRDAFLEKVRFDVPPNEKTSEGLSLGSLEVSGIDRFSLRMMKLLSPPDTLLQLLGARSVFFRVASKLASSASGFCLIASLKSDKQNDIDVGRAWQDVWLRLTQERLAAQPMMSLLVIQNMFDNGKRDLFNRRDQAVSADLLEQFNAFCSKITHGRPAALMRFGSAAEPSGRVGRLSLEKLAIDVLSTERPPGTLQNNRTGCA